VSDIVSIQNIRPDAAVKELFLYPMSYGGLTRGRKAGKPQNPTRMLIEDIPIPPGNLAVIPYQVLGEIQGARRRHFS
jgi:hypothetical protein